MRHWLCACSPGERIELWADFAGRKVGTELRLQSLPFFDGQVGGMGMMGQGLYLYHCHNLEHEDLGLMRNYRIRA